jgi:hypothetical protein
VALNPYAPFLNKGVTTDKQVQSQYNIIVVNFDLSGGVYNLQGSYEKGTVFWLENLKGRELSKFR